MVSDRGGRWVRGVWEARQWVCKSCCYGVTEEVLLQEGVNCLCSLITDFELEKKENASVSYHLVPALQSSCSRMSIASHILTIAQGSPWIYCHIQTSRMDVRVEEWFLALNL